MTIRVRNGIIYKVIEGHEFAIGSLFDGASEMDEKTIECGADIIPAVEKFISDVNSGTFKPRKLVKELEIILDRHAIK